jgi:GTP-binding protein EngB required for normal cell division
MTAPELSATVADPGVRSEMLRAQLLAIADEAAAVPGISRKALDELKDKLARRIFNLVVAGEFKRGKSSIVNALLGAEVLPTGVVPLTSVVTLLSHGDKPSATVIHEDGREEPVALNALVKYVTERGNPRNAKRVRKVQVTYPAPWLGRGLRLVDTPGIGSAYQHNTEVTYRYLPNADAVIFVASVDQPISHSEQEFLADIRHHAGKLFCLLNKADHLTPAELAESMAFVAVALREAVGDAVPLFPVSARLALQARTQPQLMTQSGFPEFDSALREFLRDESETVWLRSVRQHLSRLLAQAKLSLELEMQAITTPLASLETKLRAFAEKKSEILQTRSDLQALLHADVRRLMKDHVEPDIEKFKRGLRERVQRQLPEWFSELRNRGTGALRAEIEERLVVEVRRAFDACRERENAEVSEAFDRICERFWQRIRQSVDELLRYSAELFSLRFEGIAAQSLQVTRSNFQYKFWQEPPGLRLLSDSLTRLLPGALSRPLILRRSQRRLAELVEMQSGRLRHDFEERIRSNADAVSQDMLGRIDAAVAAIEDALDKGFTLKAGSESEVAMRSQSIAMALERTQTIVARLHDGAPLPED